MRGGPGSVTVRARAGLSGSGFRLRRLLQEMGALKMVFVMGRSF